MKIYLASQYTVGDPIENVNRQIDAAAKLLDAGHIPFAPLLCHYIDQRHPRSYETWVNYDNEWVLACDAVLRLPGPSKGADAEVELAKANGIQVFHNIDVLIGQTCGMTGKRIPPEDAGGCNNADGCDSCPHNDEE